MTQISNAHQRKKEPEKVRQLILQNTMRLAAESGMQGVSIQAVADLSNVTKGGVFHHFPNKQSLITAMISSAMHTLDDEVEKYLATKTIEYGCFTRAYIELTLTSENFGIGSVWSALCLTFISDQAFCAEWNQWLAQRLVRHQATDQDMNLQLLRYAADGAWLMEGFKSENQQKLIDIKNELIQRSFIKN
ncbi:MULTISPECIES: TetR/AcrR family transcriptional regulator [Acinetobacter]|nr:MULTISPECIES: TetR/AcrR family transcriptional regulator [Acinetobacter]